MTEALLHYLWKFRLFNSNNLKTKSFENIEVIHPGIHNHNSGPDFSNAKIKIGNKIWAGHVELHIAGNDWYAHKHHEDPAYQNVILHVVLSSKDIHYQCLQNENIPCVELENRIEKRLLARYENLMHNQLSFPCANLLDVVDDFTKRNMIERVAVERLESKTLHIQSQLKLTNGNWEQVCWQMLARYLGSGIHGDALEQTASKIPVTTLAKHSDNPTQIEALIFGVAGLLNEQFSEDYPNELKREFNYLKRLHHLQELNKGVFKWAKTRPANFPTIRLAQLAAMGISAHSLLSNLLKQDIQFLHSFINHLKVNVYWKNHFQFDEEAENKFTSIGKNTIQILTINAVVPLLFAYGKHTGNDVLTERALDILRKSKVEKNSIITLYQSYNFPIENALDSQGILQLKQNYCDKKQCLNCGIGNKILRANT